MAACDFTIAFQESAEDLILKVRETLVKAGGTMDGGVKSGNFSLSTPLGTIKGTYLVDGEYFRVIVDDKPMLLPCKTIEAELTKHVQRM